MLGALLAMSSFLTISGAVPDFMKGILAGVIMGLFILLIVARDRAGRTSCDPRNE